MVLKYMAEEREGKGQKAVRNWCKFFDNISDVIT